MSCFYTFKILLNLLFINQVSLTNSLKRKLNNDLEFNDSSKNINGMNCIKKIFKCYFCNKKIIITLDLFESSKKFNIFNSFCDEVIIYYTCKICILKRKIDDYASVRRFELLPKSEIIFTRYDSKYDEFTYEKILLMHFEIFKENDGFFNTFLLHKFEFFYIPVNEYFIVLDSNKNYQRELSFSALLENSSKIDLFFKLEIEKMKEHVANFPTKEKIILDHALKSQEKHQNKSIFDLDLNYYFNTIASENLLLKFIKNNSGLYDLIKNLIKNSKCLDFKIFIVSNSFINQNDKSFDVISEKIKDNFSEGNIDFISILSLAYEISENKIVFTKTDCVIAFNLFCINLLDNDANSIVFFDECKFFKIFLNDKKNFDEMHYNIGFAQILYFIYTFSVLTNLDWINFLNNRKNLENVYIDHKYAKKSVNEDNSISLKIRKNFLVLLKHDLRKIFFLLIEPMLMGKNFVHYYTIIMLEHILIYKVMNNVEPSANLIFERIQKICFFL